MNTTLNTIVEDYSKSADYTDWREEALEDALSFSDKLIELVEEDAPPLAAYLLHREFFNANPLNSVADELGFQVERRLGDVEHELRNVTQSWYWRFGGFGNEAGFVRGAISELETDLRRLENDQADALDDGDAELLSELKVKEAELRESLEELTYELELREEEEECLENLEEKIDSLVDFIGELTGGFVTADHQPKQTVSPEEFVLWLENDEELSGLTADTLSVLELCKELLY